MAVRAKVAFRLAVALGAIIAASTEGWLASLDLPADKLGGEGREWGSLPPDSWWAWPHSE